MLENELCKVHPRLNQNFAIIEAMKGMSENREKHNWPKIGILNRKTIEEIENLIKKRVQKEKKSKNHDLFLYNASMCFLVAFYTKSSE